MRIVHRYWNGPADPPGGKWLDGVIRGMSLQVHDWTDAQLDDDVLALLDRLGERVPEDQRPRQRANVLRWVLLQRFGGIWMDHDVIPLIDLNRLPETMIAAHGTPCTCVIAMQANDTWANDMLQTIEDNTAPADSSAISSGERLLTAHIPPRVERWQLLYGPNGQRLPGSRPWAVHLFNSSGERQ